MSSIPSVTKPSVTIAHVRTAFLNYFKSQGHTIVDSVPLLPKGDPTLLFVNSGMVPFKECFRGLETRPYKRATSCQKSLRVSGKHNDYEQIGQTPRHHTFFEMLGNFSLSDYFKREAITFAWEFVTKTLQMPTDRLWVTIHRSDDEAEKLWGEITVISPERIIRLGDDSNLWAMGDFGPRGYCSEIFYYIGDNPESQSREEFMKDDGTYLEFWNLVFMQFNRNQDGTVTPLPKPCIDTGIGLERLAAILQGAKSNYDTDILRGLIAKAEELSGLRYDGTTYDSTKLPAKQWERDVAMRVIADHARAISFLIADGVIPSNEKEGYVLRRLIRRATLRGEVLGIHNPFLTNVTDEVVKRMSDAYPELTTQIDLIRKLTEQEETQFRKTLAGGLKLLGEATESLTAGAVLSGDTAFKLHDTFGFPLDLTEDVLKERKIRVDRERFTTLMDEQKERSRAVPKGATAVSSLIKELKIEGSPSEFLGYNTLEADSKILALTSANQDSATPLYYLTLETTPFYAEMGGQIGDRGTIRVQGVEFDVLDTQKTHSGHVVHLASPRPGQLVNEKLVGEKAVAQVNAAFRKTIARHHSGTHLLGAALRTILGPHTEQRGSLVSQDKLRFDFAHPHAITPDQISALQELINRIIRENHEVVTSEMPIADAKKRGAVAVFGEKYGETVRVVEMGPLSVELCGGTHVTRTGDIGFEILLSEGSIATGVRRIEAVAGEKALGESERIHSLLSISAGKVKGTLHEVPQRIDALYEKVASLERDNESLVLVLTKLISERLLSEKNGGKIIAKILPEKLDRSTLMLAAENTVGKLTDGAVALIDRPSGNLVVVLSKELSSKLNAGNIVKQIASTFGGKGGGKPQSASLVSIPIENIEKALELAVSLLNS